MRSVSASPQTNRASNITLTPSPPNVQSPFPRGFGQLTGEGDKDISRQIEEAQFQLSALSDTIARARSGLVQELVEVFSVVEVRADCLYDHAQHLPYPLFRSEAGHR